MRTLYSELKLLDSTRSNILRQRLHYHDDRESYFLDFTLNKYTLGGNKVLTDALDGTKTVESSLYELISEERKLQQNSSIFKARVRTSSQLRRIAELEKLIEIPSQLDSKVSSQIKNIGNSIENLAFILGGVYLFDTFGLEFSGFKEALNSYIYPALGGYNINRAYTMAVLGGFVKEGKDKNQLSFEQARYIDEKIFEL